MYAGMADVAALTGDSAYIHAIGRIWDNIVGKKYYITGGIGATSNGEAFGANYELPNMSAYCETCAAIGNVYVNHRLFLLHGDSKCKLSGIAAYFSAHAIGIFYGYVEKVAFACSLIMSYGSLYHMAEVVKLMAEFFDFFPPS